MKHLFGGRHRATGLAITSALVLACGLSSGPALADDAAPVAGAALARALDVTGLRALAMGQSTTVRGVPVDGRTFDLELERFDVWTADGVFMHDNQPAARPNIVLLRGTVAGDADSQVVIGLGEHATNGFVRSAGNTYSLSTGGQADTDLLRAVNMAEFKFNGQRPGCGITADNAHQFNPTGRPLTVDLDAAPQHDPRGTPCRVARVAIDSDWEWTSEVFGGDGLASAEYAVFLMAAISEVYVRDVNVRLVIPYLRTFSSNSDPYTGNTSPDPLDQVMAHWNANMGHVQREVTHLFTGADTSYGGVAYLSVVCFNDFGYGVSSYMDGSFPYPLQENSYSNWDLVVCSHELGHNFGTLHTHDGYDPPIDRCGIDCTGNLNGTIMSYCHICPGGLINIDLRFHPLVQQVIENYLAFDVSCNLEPAAAALPDSVETPAGQAVDIFVLANDSGPGCAPVAISTFPAITANGGTVTLQGWSNPTGNPTSRFLRYTPAANFSGIDSFTYTNTNGNSALVTIDVEGFRPPDVVSNPVAGLTSAYYSISQFTGSVPDFSGMTPVAESVSPDLNYPSTSGNAVGGPLANYVGAEFIGFVTVPQQGIYTFSLESDDGSILWVGDEEVVNNDGLHGMVVQSGSIGLEPGTHAVRVGFFEAGGGAGLIFSWSGPGVATGVVPASALVHEGAQNCGLADLAEPFGVLDLADISLFIDAFINQQAPADVAAPFGVWDLADIAGFIGAFNAGCP